MTVRAFVCYGQGGAAVGPVLALGDGPKAIAAKMNQIAGVHATLHQWDQGSQIAAAVKALPPDVRVIIGGTSLGANEAPLTASYCSPRQVDMIFGVQPSMYGRRNLIPANVKKALCFYNPIYLLTMGLGAYKWGRANNSKATLLTWQTYYGHPGDNVAWIQDAIITHARMVASLP